VAIPLQNRHRALRNFITRELSCLTVCLRLWEAVPNEEHLEEYHLARWLVALTEYMSYPFASAEPSSSSSNNRSGTNEAPPQYSEMIDEVRSLFSAPAENGFGQGFEQFTRRQFTGSSVATSGTHFDPSNPIHELAKQIFSSHEDDVLSVKSYQSRMF